MSNFEPKDSAVVLNQLLRKLDETATGPLVFERYVAQLRVLVQLRNMQPLFEAAMDNLAKYVNEQGDPFYVKGKNLGFILGAEQGIQQGIQEGLQQGIQEGRQKGIQEGRQKGIQEGRQKGIQEGATKTQRQLVKNLLMETDFADDKIARLTSVSVDVVQEVRRSLNRE